MESSAENSGGAGRLQDRSGDSSEERPDDLLRQIRLAIYQEFVERGTAPPTVELAQRFGLSPRELDGVMRELAESRSALVLMPGSSYLWMAEPFSAVPTHFPVLAGGQTYYGNCIWDALAILALLGREGEIPARSPLDDEPLIFSVRNGELQPCDAVIHFAVPARDWWRSIGFT